MSCDGAYPDKGAHSSSLDPDVEARVSSIMKEMDLIDKVGEMTQLTLDAISVGEPYNLKEPHQLDMAKLRRALVDLRVGSVLNVGGHAYSVKRWREIIDTIQNVAVNEKASGIPVLYGIDAVHGSNYTLGSTLFPQQIALAATWNPGLAYEQGRITSYETRASAIPWSFAPVLDIGRDPRWSRLWETFGEDVFLASKMGEEMIKGYQISDLSDPYSTAACMKHFMGYSLPLTGKDRTQAWIPERQLREYVMPTFQKAIDAGAATIMICSGEINGIPVHSSSWVLKDLLRDEMGFTGLAVSDWEDIIFLYSRHKIAKDHKEAIKMAVNAGIDMSMVPLDTQFPILLKELVEEGAVSMSRIDEAVRRIIRLKVQLGLFENPSITSNTDYSKFGGAEHAKAALKTAEESITLLKNDNNRLPLDKNLKVFVGGPTANSMLYLNGGWSRTWQGDNASFVEEGKLTIMQAVKQKVGDRKFDYQMGTQIIDTDQSFSKAVRQARQADVAVICIGEATYTEKPGDIDDLSLPENQIELVKAIAKTNTPIVLVLVEGRPRLIREIEPLADAILHAYLPGNEGGQAIANILFGEVNPSGKLPYTYPKYPNSLITYDHKGTDQISIGFGTDAFSPQFEFGHGLSYTNFEYSNLSLNATNMGIDGEITITVDVQNTGKRAGKEVVQLYVTDHVASITPAVKRLRAFEKIELAAEEKKSISFQLKASDLAFVGREMKWITEAGAFSVQIADLSAAFEIE